MSHYKGFFSSCPGRWVNAGRARYGIQQQRCSRCGRVRRKKVRPCLFFHDWRNSGKPNYGKQQQRCMRCGSTRVTQRKRCLFSHRWSAKGGNGQLRCVNCGTPK